MEPRVSSGVAGWHCLASSSSYSLVGGGGVERRSSSPTPSVIRSSSSFLRLPRLPSLNFYLFIFYSISIFNSPSFHSSFPLLRILLLPPLLPLSLLFSFTIPLLSSLLLPLLPPFSIHCLPALLLPFLFLLLSPSSFSLPSFSFTPPPRRFPWTHFLLLFFSFSLNSAGIFLSNGCHSVISRDLSLADR